MAPLTKAGDTILASKRARSANPSRSGSPMPEKLSPFEDSALPAFLKLSRPDIAAKFEELNQRQFERMEQSEATDGEDSEWAQDFSRIAKARNRYLDIKPWSKARVRLRVPESECDYINASPILLKCSKTDSSRNYIATQGPKDNGVDHFWQMIWHETKETAVIVMLTQLAEGGREKCFQYYPEDQFSEAFDLTFTDKDGGSHNARLSVESCTYDDHCKTTVRTLKLSCQENSKLVHHLLFRGWPDYGVPASQEDRSALTQLIELSQIKNSGWLNPRIIHCSAGVGRSGTFIALEHLLAELDSGQLDEVPEDEDPVFDTVDSLRQQRMTMVQSELQFVFIYDTLYDAFRHRLRGTKDGSGRPTTKQKLSALGEPSPKAMRFSKGIKNVFSNLRERSRSRKRRPDETGDEQASPGTPLANEVARSDSSSPDTNLHTSLTQRFGRLQASPAPSIGEQEETAQSSERESAIPRSHAEADDEDPSTTEEHYAGSEDAMHEYHTPDDQDASERELAETGGPIPEIKVHESPASDTKEPSESAANHSMQDAGGEETSVNSEAVKEQ